MEWYIPAGIAITVAVMLSASYFDWRYREVPDVHWWVLGLSGIVLTAVSLTDGMRLEWTMMLLGSVMILFFILFDIEVSRTVSVLYVIAMAVLFIYPAVTAFDDQTVRCFLVIPVCFVIFYLMFMLGVLRGGADAKCLMVMAMMFQTYPEI